MMGIWVWLLLLRVPVGELHGCAAGPHPVPLLRRCRSPAAACPPSRGRVSRRWPHWFPCRWCRSGCSRGQPSWRQSTGEGTRPPGSWAAHSASTWCLEVWPPVTALWPRTQLGVRLSCSCLTCSDVWCRRFTQHTQSLPSSL